MIQSLFKSFFLFSAKRLNELQGTPGSCFHVRVLKGLQGHRPHVSYIPKGLKRGFKIIKAKNDVEDGIRLVATKLNLQKIVFSTACINTIKEFASYIWDKKAAENGEDKPVKQYDHAMDAVRYFVYTILGERPRLNRKVKGGI